MRHGILRIPFMTAAARIASAVADGRLVTRADAASGLVEIVGTGFWSSAEVDRHFAELAPLVARLRRTHASLLVLADLSDSVVQAAATTERLQRETRQIWRPGDRIATVVRSALAGMQANRAVDGGNHRIFMTTAAARTWLGIG